MEQKVCHGYGEDEQPVLTLKAIANAVNPNSKDYILFTEPKQSLMSMALFAQGLLRSKTQIWNNLPMDVQARVI